MKVKKRCEKFDIYKILDERGIEKQDCFFRPYLFVDEPSPFDLKNMDLACDKTIEKIKNGENILVVADVDTDGVMSGLIVYNGLKEIYDKVDIVIGTGKTHGITQHNISEYKNKPGLVIACDSGSSEFEEYEKLKSNKIDVVILDHHESEYESDFAIVVNSEMNDYYNKSLSGAGVCLYFLRALSLKGQKINYDNYYDLSATGLIADMMDMSNIYNRLICYKGLNNVKNPGLKRLIGNYDFTSQTVSFSIAPLINAAQRMKQNQELLDFFLKNNKPKDLKRLQELKEKQNEIVINTAIKSKSKKFNNFIFIEMSENETDLASGMSGLMANKYMETNKKPTIVVYKSSDGKYKGSIRSIPGIDFKTIINNTKLAYSEGHENAAGIEIEYENVDKFLSELEKTTPKKENGDSVVDVDSGIMLYDLSEANVGVIDSVNFVCGTGFEQLSFVIEDILLPNISVLKEKHSTFNVGEIKFFKWNDVKFAELYANKKVSLIGTPNLSSFMGKTTVNFVIKEVVENDC